MTVVKLRRVDTSWAKASRLLGAGVSLAFHAQGMSGELSLQLHAQPLLPHLDFARLCTSRGDLQLSNAEAVLSLLGELPVTLSGQYQPWYWQFINQRLSPAIAELISPLEPLIDSTTSPASPITCRLQVRLGDQRVDAMVSTDADILLRLLDAPGWQQHVLEIVEEWSVTQPVIVGQLSLTLDQLASVRPGDVVIPSHTFFDSEGTGSTSLAGRRWAVQTESRNRHLYMRLRHEENLEHE
jgi:type III secretion protein Q